MPLVNTGPGAVHLKLANSERKKGYNYAKISFVTTKLNVNYTKPKLPPSSIPTPVTVSLI